MSLKHFLTNTWLQLAHEAVKCEEKEEKLVKDAVQHLTQANSQIKDLHHQFTHKVIYISLSNIYWMFLTRTSS